MCPLAMRSSSIASWPIKTTAQLNVGQPALDGAHVTAEVVSVVQGPKLVIQKARRRKTYRRKTGHRQLYTRVKINKIVHG